jgi:hypothetical protein
MSKSGKATTQKIRGLFHSLSSPLFGSSAAPVTSAGAEYWNGVVRKAVSDGKADRYQAIAGQDIAVGKRSLCTLKEDDLIAATPGDWEDLSDIDWPSSPAGVLKSPKAKHAQNRISTASTAAGSSRLSCVSHCSWDGDMEAGTEELVLDKEALLTSLPLPVGIRAWDWPLSRHEKKSLVLMLDRKEIVAQKDELAIKLSKIGMK